MELGHTAPNICLNVETIEGVTNAYKSELLV